MKDLNHDGLADLALSFDAGDLKLEGEVATLAGRTFDGVPFRGSDVVVVRNEGRVALGEGETIPAGLALSIKQTLGGTGINLLLNLPGSGPATIEVFDVAGPLGSAGAPPGADPRSQFRSLSAPPQTRKSGS